LFGYFTFCATYQVDGANVPAYLQSVVDGDPTNDTIKSLEVPKLILRANGLVTEIQDLSTAASAWTIPIAFALWRARLDGKIDAVNASLREIARYKVCFAGIEKTKAAVKATEDSTWKTGRDSISRSLRSYGVPASLAKPAADYLQEVVLSRAVPNFVVPVTNALTIDALTSPMLFKYTTAAVDNEVALVTACRNFYVQNLPAVEKKKSDKVKQMVEAGSTHYHVMLKSDNKLDWNSDGSGLINGTKLDPILHITGNNQLDLHHNVLPYLGQRSVTTCFMGSLLALVAEPAQVLKASNVHDHVTNAHHSVFSTHQIVVMRPGDSLYLPIGYVACIVGRPVQAASNEPVIPGTNVKKSDADPYCAWTMCAPFVSALDLRHSREVTAWAAASWLSSLPKVPQSIAGADPVAKWLSELQGRKDEPYDA